MRGLKRTLCDLRSLLPGVHTGSDNGERRGNGQGCAEKRSFLITPWHWKQLISTGEKGVQNSAVGLEGRCAH